MDEAICVRVCLCVTLIFYLGQNNYPKCRRHCVQLGGTCNICSTFLGHQIQNGNEHIRLQALLESWSGQVIDYFSYDTAKRADETGGTSARKQKSHQAGSRAALPATTITTTTAVVRINKMPSFGRWPGETTRTTAAETTMANCDGKQFNTFKRMCQQAKLAWASGLGPRPKPKPQQTTVDGQTTNGQALLTPWQDLVWQVEARS